MDLQEQPTECAFHIGDTTVCSSDDMIAAMVSFLKKYGIDTGDSAEEVITSVKEHTKCDTEVCIYEKSPFVTHIGRDTASEALDSLFKPPGPRSRSGLLSNFHIDEVLSQFEKKYKGFKHVPYQMRDFQEKKTELATIDLAQEYKSGMKTLGCVLNTDWSSGKGIHWYCIFVDFTKSEPVIEYFNTSGGYPPPETQKWIMDTKYKLQKQLNKKVNNVQVLSKIIQDNDYDCGVYCLYYIWSRLEGFPYTVFSDPATAPNDRLMGVARKHLFRNSGR